MKCRPSTLALSVILYGLLLSPAAFAQLSFDEIALEFTGGLGFLDTEAAPAIDENGRVLFDGFNPTGDEKLFVGDGGALTTINIDAGGYSDVSSVQINASDHVAWISRRFTKEFMIGAYRTNAAGTFSAILREGPESFDPLNPPVRNNIALSPNGTVAYSTIVNGDGAIYRHFIAGASTVMREGSGNLFNNKRLDVNDAGEVVIQMEYLDLTLGLARGLPVFNASNLWVNSAVEKMDVSIQVQPNMNASGDVAFSLNSNSTMTFYDPPDDVTGTVVAVVTLMPGIYIATPAPFGEPPIYTQVVDTTTGFSSFGTEVQLNDNGVVVFSATKPFVANGIYFGPDPVADKILETGDQVEGRQISFIKMGELNDANQLAIITEDYFSTDRQVWRVNNVPEPDAAVMLGVGLFGLIALAVRRRR